MIKEIKLWTRLLGLLAGIGVLVVVPLVVFAAIHSREADLSRRGVETQALVVGVDARGELDYLLVRYPECDCRVPVATSNLARHPVGSVLRVRYDAQHPDHAEALVDRPNASDQVLVILVMGVLTMIVLVPVVVVATRRQQRARRMVKESLPIGPVRVEAWRRSYLHSTIPYLSVYRANGPGGSPPLLALAVTEETMAQVADLPDWNFDLFGGTEPGQAVALRRGELVVAASSTKSAEWEGKHRQAQGTVVLDKQDVLTSDHSIFGDERSARTYRRLRGLQRLTYVVFIPLLLLRVAPDWLLPAAVVATFVVCGAMGVLSWRMRKLLSRLTDRLPGPGPTTRSERRLARAEVARRISSAGGKAELAARLDVSAEALAASDRRAARWVSCSFALTVVLGVAAAVRLIVSF